jgi:hypothetical protein
MGDVQAGLADGIVYQRCGQILDLVYCVFDAEVSSICRKLLVLKCYHT